MSHIDLSYAQSLKLDRNFTLHDLLASFEDGQLNDDQEINISIMPPVNANDDLTDEDSGDENSVSVNNLPGSQLMAEAELNNAPSDDDDDAEDNIPLRILQLALTKSKRKYNWENIDLAPAEVEWPVMSTVLNRNSPIELFNLFMDQELVDMFLTRTNMYAAKHNRNGNIVESEIRSFFGILILSGYVPLPRRRMFWENCQDTHNSVVANALSRDRFEFIMANLHCCDNDRLDTSDRFAKVRPLFDAVNKKFLEFSPHSENHSVDESMVPYYGKHGCKQCILNKPIRFGYKMWTGCTSKGYVNWIEPYQGAKSAMQNSYRDFGLGPSVVLQYADVLRKIGDYPYHIYCDNFFTTLALLETMSLKNFRVTGTIRDNRLLACPLSAKNIMKKQARGTFEYMTSNNKFVVTKWNDNNVVCLASNATSVYPIHNVSRYSRKENKAITVTQPHIIHQYNVSMGGVYRCDQNVSLYRTNIRGKKWYFCLISHCLDLMIQNSWLLHKMQGGTLDQLAFRRRIAMAILETNKESRKRGRPSNLENADSRFDRMDHFVASQEKQTRCRVCHKKVKTKCVKCGVALHVDCFIPYHRP